MFEIAFIADKDIRHLGMAMVLCLVKPSPNIRKGFFVCDVVDQKTTGSSSIVGASQRLKFLLASLKGKNEGFGIFGRLTVSQIERRIFSSLRSTVFIANSTPMVGSWNSLKLFSVNLFKRVDFPTPGYKT